MQMELKQWKVLSKTDILIKLTEILLEVCNAVPQQVPWGPKFVNYSIKEFKIRRQGIK